jgi:hypothetical protein
MCVLETRLMGCVFSHNIFASNYKLFYAAHVYDNVMGVVEY